MIDLRDFDESSEIKEETALYDSDDFYEENKIMAIVRKKGATYPSEISRFSEFTPRQASRIINTLIEKGKLMLAKVAFYRADERVLNRRHELWGLGIKGFERFHTMRWVVEPPEQNVTVFR